MRSRTLSLVEPFFCVLFLCSGAGLQVILHAVVTFVQAKFSSLSVHSRLEGHVIFPPFQSLEGVAGLPVRDVRMQHQ